MIILDVREKEEFQSEHIPDSICCPLSQFDLIAPGILRNMKDMDVVVMCRTGNRAKMALNELKKIDIEHHRFTCYEGGIQKWKQEGKPVVGAGASLPIMRQVQIVASSMVFLAFIGFFFIHPNFVFLALMVGFGLALAGYTGFCPMVFILQKMPWNNRSISQKNGGQGSCCQ